MPDRKTNKEIELKVVDEDAGASEDIVRLDGTDAIPVARVPVAPRDDVPARLEAQPANAPRRENQPTLDALLEENRVDLDPEHDWKEQEEAKPVPHGWFVVIFLLMAAVIVISVFSLTRPEEEQVTEIARTAALESLESKAVMEAEATDLVGNIRRTVESFAAAETVEELLPVVRQPDRVEPLIRDWQKRHSLSRPPLTFFGGVSPMLKRDDLEIWRAEYIDDQEKKRALLVEVTPEHEVRVDWETFVCYQPMDWDDFVDQRPEGKPMQFRVYLEPDAGNLYAFEFRDEERWQGYQLTARESQEFLIGYVERGGEIDMQIRQMLYLNRGGKVALILTLSVPENVQSLRGVKIDELVSDSWLIFGDS